MTCILNTIFRPGKINLRILRMLTHHSNTRLFSFHAYQRTVSSYGHQNSNFMNLRCSDCMAYRVYVYSDTRTNINSRNFSSETSHVIRSHASQHHSHPPVRIYPSGKPDERQCSLHPIVRCASNGKGQSSHNGERENRRIKRLTILIGNIFVS